LATNTSASLRKTALNATHRALGGKMVDFAGFEMPVEYRGIIEEHRAVRTAAGLFDVSHMGEIEIRGPSSLELVQQVTCNDAGRLQNGQAQYTALLTDRGTFVDDLLVHRLSAEHYLLCINASNREKDFEHIRAQNLFNAQLEDAGDRYTQLALQGPKAETILAGLTPVDLTAIAYYQFTFGQVAGAPCLVARTGYTGEDGFELYLDPTHSEKVWNGLLDAGHNDGLIPVGLGARNTLRLEAALALYGNDIDDTTTPLEAKLAWICKFDKGDFTGRDALLKQKENGLKRTLVGFEMRGRGIAREGYPVQVSGKECGRVTSGSFAPFLEKNIGLAYVAVEHKAPGTGITIVIRGRPVAAEIVPIPFYRRPK
jgi:aminomethyltransferase